MKKLTLLSLLLAGVCSAPAVADVFVPNSDFYSGKWVYLWTPTNGSGFSTAVNWSIVKTGADTTLTASTTNTPAAGDPKFFGYTFSYEDGVQSYTYSDTAVTVSNSEWYSGTYYLGNVTFANTRADGYAGFGSGGTNIYVGDYGASEQTIFTMDKAALDGTVNFSGALTMTGDTFSRTLVSYTTLFRILNDATWNGSGISVTDANGVLLQYSDTATTEAGYFYIETSGAVGSAYTVTLKANGTQAIPEPTTATLSLLALAGFAARRRRK